MTIEKGHKKARVRAQYLVRCTQDGCRAKAGPLEDRERARCMAIEHAVAFKHSTEIMAVKQLRTFDPRTLARLTST